MITENDLELLNFLNDQISNGSIIVHASTSDIIDEIEKHYPFRHSGIEWSIENYIYTVNVHGSELVLKQKYVYDFLENIEQNHPETSNEKVIVLGDYMTNFGFEMQFKVFIEIHEFFFSIPQDTYVWFPNLQKCINYTFEDELFFG